MTKALLLALTVLVSACANMGPIDQKKRAEINDIGFVSVLPQELKILYMGTTIFENKDDKYPIISWNLPSLMQQEFAALLKAQGKNMKTLKLKEPLKEMSERNMKEEEVKKVFAEAKAQGAKYLFVLSSSRHGSLPFPEGAALYCRSAFGMKGSWTGTLQVHVGLWDLEKGEKVYQTAYFPDDGMAKTEKPCAEWDKSKTKTFAETFKPELQRLARDVARKVLQNSELIPGKPKSSFEQ